MPVVPQRAPGDGLTERDGSRIGPGRLAPTAPAPIGGPRTRATSQDAAREGLIRPLLPLLPTATRTQRVGPGEPFPPRSTRPCDVRLRQTLPDASLRPRAVVISGEQGRQQVPTSGHARPRTSTALRVTTLACDALAAGPAPGLVARPAVRALRAAEVRPVPPRTGPAPRSAKPSPSGNRAARSAGIPAVRLAPQEGDQKEIRGPPTHCVRDDSLTKCSGSGEERPLTLAAKAESGVGGVSSDPHGSTSAGACTLPSRA